MLISGLVGTFLAGNLPGLVKHSTSCECPNCLISLAGRYIAEKGNPYLKTPAHYVVSRIPNQWNPSMSERRYLRSWFDRAL